MSEVQLNDDYVRLLTPIYLKRLQADRLNAANQQRSALKVAWSSLRQANWLAEITARATSVQQIQQHLQKQGRERWQDRNEKTPLYAVIDKEIGPLLHRSVERAILAAGEQAAQVLRLPQSTVYQPSADWLNREHLALARLYILSLVAWYRIDQAANKETEKQ